MPLVLRPYLPHATAATAPSPTHFVPERRYSVEEWLAIEEATGGRYEYHDGTLVSRYVMTGETFARTLLTGNAIGQLGRALRECSPRRDDCSVLSGGLRFATEANRYLYAYASIVCGPARFDEVVTSVVVNPVCVIEAISKSSALLDTCDKFEWYAEL